MKRRSFIKLGATGGVGLYVATQFGFVQRAVAAIPGGSLLPRDVTKFVQPLIKPPAMPTASRGRGSKKLDFYNIAVRQFQQQILPSSHPMTTVWSYGSQAHPGTVAQGGTFNYPAFTIEARHMKPVRINWINGLTDDAGKYLPHLLPVDPSLHWANPPGGLAGRDATPTFTTEPTPYLGPVPIVTHVHGAHTTEDSDGYPEAWYLPDAKNIPKGYAETGTFFDYFNTKYGKGWGPGSALYEYPNDQRATTLWYHDHALGMTRLNVYAGPAGFYLLRGGTDDQVDGVLPGPAPGVGDSPFGTFYEIPIVIQDRSFNDDGSLFYPDNRFFFDEFEGPYIPESPLSPIWNPEFFANMMVVNGNTWPHLEVERRRYRFRFLNGCNSRFLVLKMSLNPRSDNGSFNTSDNTFWQIGSDGGFLPEAVELDHLLIAPAERADVIIDFADFAPGTEIILVNDGPDAPFGGISTEDIADHASTGQVMKFIVGNAPEGGDPSTHPSELGLPTIGFDPLGPAMNTQILSLNEEPYDDVPLAALLGTYDTDTETPTPLRWHHNITEIPEPGVTEIWELHNLTEDAHPIHLHQVQFQVIGREPFEGGTSEAGSNDPLPWETGFKDTVIAYPGEITRVKARFDIPGYFVWHCHILEHEDNEMMRPLHVGPVQVVTVASSDAPEMQLSSYPDPFNPTTTIRFELPRAGNVKLEVFDVTGRRVATLVNGPMEAGLQQVSFDASNLPSGLYLSHLSAAGQEVTHKMLLVK